MRNYKSTNTMISAPVSLVSVVVITYNSSLYVTETLESIKNQEYQELELIISDDCSTDNTLAVCEKWLNENKYRFKNTLLLRQPVNRGIPANCNNGWREASGNWIKLIAGDDILLPACIGDNMQFIDANPNAKVIYAEAVKIDEHGKTLPAGMPFYKTDVPEWRNYFFGLGPKEQLSFFAQNPIFLITPSLFVNRNILDAINGFDEHLRIFEDIPFVIKVLKTGERLWYFSTPTVCYRIHSQSISKKKDKDKERRMLEELRYTYRTYRKKELQSFHIFDLSARFEAWLTFEYVLTYHGKGARFLKMLNPLELYKFFIRIRHRNLKL